MISKTMPFLGSCPRTPLAEGAVQNELGFQGAMICAIVTGHVQWRCLMGILQPGGHIRWLGLRDTP